MLDFKRSRGKLRGATGGTTGGAINGAIDGAVSTVRAAAQYYYRLRYEGQLPTLCEEALARLP